MSRKQKREPIGVICDLCSYKYEKTPRFFETDDDTVIRVRRILVKQGWYCNMHLNQDLCPPCWGDKKELNETIYIPEEFFDKVLAPSRVS